MNQNNPMPKVFDLHCGTSPLLISMPHIGTHIPSQLQNNYIARALAVEDTDWHLARLYNSLNELGASLITPAISRYVIDLNRPPNDAPMYPGASNTELCPTRFFTGDPLYKPGCEPNQAERERRRTAYWQPYHEALVSELNRIKSIHGYALLWDAHSIRSAIPWLFDGQLPALNIGTVSGASADTRISDAIMHVCNNNPQISAVLNGRFKGGYITRRYGQPSQHVHAIQLEMCQNLYMQEVAPFDFDMDRATTIQPVLHTMLTHALNACMKCYEK